MDQDSFRTLLSSGSGSRGTPSSNPRGNLLSSASSKSKKIDASKPVFKPRKVKKAAEEGKYRDRAAERREGGGNDYAHVESVLEDFERRNATNEDKKTVEEQRKYLGGDSDHSILVKGLDMALLEQNKARALLDTTEDDDTLEQAYKEASSASSAVPKKRTRADILNELKQKRSQVENGTPSNSANSKADNEQTVEEAKKQGKFKPIGFKPIGSSDDKEKKKKKKLKSSGDGASTKESSERKKKKRKLESSEASGKTDQPLMGMTEEQSVTTPTAPTSSVSKRNTEPEAEPEALGDDFDIFAGAGDYDGLDLGDEDEDEDGEVDENSTKPRRGSSPGPGQSVGSKGWFVTEDDDAKEESPGARSSSPGLKRHEDEDVRMEDGEEEEQPMRLQPLQSSALPSIREFLAMDEAAEVTEKRRQRKEKKKAGGGGGGGGGKSMEQKVNRDYQRLQSYTSKKEASGSR